MISSVIEGTDTREILKPELKDFFIDTLSPAKACDPWAVYSAKSFSKEDGSNVEITETQSKILQILKETGGAKSRFISERLQIKPSELEREISVSCHTTGCFTPACKGNA